MGRGTVIPDIFLTVDCPTTSREKFLRAKVDKGVKYVVQALISTDSELFRCTQIPSTIIYLPKIVIDGPLNPFVRV